MEKKHKNNKHIGIMILIAFILIVAGIITYIVINYNNAQTEIKKRMDYVLTEYDVFKTNIDKFNTTRESIYNEIMQDTYYQTLKDNDANYKEKFEEYSAVIDLLDDNYENLKDKCINVLYPDVNVNNKCEAFVLGYEKVVNTYISDVESYNKKIDLLNVWIKTNDEGAIEVEKIKLDREYIDVDGNRKFDGKKETKEEIESEKEEGKTNE